MQYDGGLTLDSETAYSNDHMQENAQPGAVRRLQRSGEGRTRGERQERDGPVPGGGRGNIQVNVVVL